MCMRGGTISCLWVCRVGAKLLERLRISDQRLEGPENDPAKLALWKTAQDMFSQLFVAATKPDHTIRFLSRFDKSATNIKESAIWASIGQMPWSYPFSSFYHICPQFPHEALETAAKLKEYTLTDRGAWLGAHCWVKKSMKVLVCLSICVRVHLG